MKYDPSKGPTIDVEIGYPISLLRPGVQPKSMMVPLMIDTGARRTHIARQVADALSLMVYSRATIHFGATSLVVDQYLGDLRFPTIGVAYSGRLFPNFPNPTKHFLGVLGRDVLEQGPLYLDGINREFTLSL
jgi:hypothetical protein